MTHTLDELNTLETKKYKIGIVLSGGGAKGFAHLGVLQALNERGIYPEVISGTSAGAFAGVLYADGNSPLNIVSFFKETTFSKFAKFNIPKGGIFNSSPFRTFLEKKLKAKTFEELKLPLYVSATNIEAGEVRFFNSGPLISPVVASCSVPVVFNPVEIDNKHYVDGGLLKKFPVSVIRSQCEVVIGVNVSPFIPSEYKNSLSYIAERTFHYMSNANMVQDRKMCDYLIESEVLSKYRMFDLKHIQEIFDMGYEITQQYLNRHKKKLQRDFSLFV